ncbi:hypothetical protein [Acetomicrobium sp.]|uniref:hypothetical protein n=1 Tax=Acetomicrobium sp. TaxID=1872099 RepID=UPI00287133C2|nr:hypothetical protein [Acetomicrobium sp.]MDR9769840.1 hypothetical protein [Acetomicrobium sp.]
MRFQKRVVDSAIAVNTALKGKVYYVNVLVDMLSLFRCPCRCQIREFPQILALDNPL